MGIKHIGLKNFKGFKDAKLNLKPLTVILGPNSAGKSCFGQALIALSETNANDGVLSLAHKKDSAVDLGSYSDVIHSQSVGEPVFIECGLKTGSICLGFGGNRANKNSGIGELDLTYVNKTLELFPPLSSTDEGSVQSFNTTQNSLHIIRDNYQNWTNLNDTNENFQIVYEGMNIVMISHDTGTVIQEDPVSKAMSAELRSLLKKISYLRPDRFAPERMNTHYPSGNKFIDERGV